MKFSRILTIVALAVLTAAATTTANAAEKVLASYTFGVINSAGPFHSGDKVVASVVEVAKDVKVLKVVSSNSNPHANEKLAPVKKSLKLSPILAQDLENNILSLVDAEIEIHESQVVCMMMPPFGESLVNLSILNSDGSVAQVLGPQGCWVHRHISPKEEYLRANAQELVLQLRTLALASLKK